MEPLANAINTASVCSIEGFALEVAPFAAGETEFHFGDAYPFQQLFTAVAELCGLKDKIAATGYALPDIATDDDSDNRKGERVMTNIIPLPDRPVTEAEVEKLHAEAFLDLEGKISDCAIMALSRCRRPSRS